MTRTRIFMSIAVAFLLASCASSPGGGGGGTGGTNGVTIAPDDMIDDMEDGDDSVLDLGKRVGFWYAYNDMTPNGVQKPEPDKDFLPEECGPTGKGKCVHITGSGFKEWGAGVGFDLNNPGAPAKRMAYDLSAYKGVAFWAKGAPPSIRLSIAIAGVVPIDEGGTCPVPAVADGPEQCHDTHGHQVRISNDWQQFVVPFSNLVQASFGHKAAWDPTTVLSVQFDVAENLNFDISIDEIGLYK